MLYIGRPPAPPIISSASSAGRQLDGRVASGSNRQGDPYNFFSPKRAQFCSRCLLRFDPAFSGSRLVRCFVFVTGVSLHVIVLLYPHGAQERGCTACVRSVLLSGWSGCRAVSAAVRPLCAVGLSGSCQAVRLGPDSDGTPLMSGSAVRLSDTCCQAVREVLSTLSGCRALSGAVRGLLSGCQTRAQLQTPLYIVRGINYKSIMCIGPATHLARRH